MKKKILAVMLIATMTISCVACGSNNSSSTETQESSSVESSKKETTTDKSDKTESKSDTETKKDDSKADDKTSESTTEDKSDNKKSDSADNSSKPAEDKKSDSNSGNTGSNSSANKPSNGNSNKSDSSTSKPSQSTEKPAESKPAHQHTWVDHTATKKVPRTVHHDAVYETVNIPAVTKWQIQCPTCGKWFDSQDELDWHQVVDTDGACGGCDPSLSRQTVITPAHTEKKLVKEAYDETVYDTQTYVDYQYCSGCGQHK